MIPPAIERPIGALRAVLRLRPTCEHRITGRRWCPRIAPSAVVVNAGSTDPLRNLSPRCRDHAIPGIPRICLSCREENRSPDEWHCVRCAEREWGTPEEDRW